MSPRALLGELRRRDPLLSGVTWLHVGLLLALLLVAPFDSRSVTGINPWIKPMKFAASIAIYTATLGWLLGYLSGPRGALRLISWGVALAMVSEMSCITLQAARGTSSHFNVKTPFDGLVFGIMGLMILLNTLLAVLLVLLFWVRRVELPAPYLWGIRLGLLIFVLGSFEGAVMIARNAHSVGVPDGGPGLPLVNWSTRGGDLRIAHLVALHALQALPLAGFLLSRRPGAGRLAVVFGVAAAYLAAAGVLFWQALQGRPLLVW